jgi:inhibitor of Bruton tyrosine kinase
MSAIHAHFALRNQQAFQRVLEGLSRGQGAGAGAPGTSAGKSGHAAVAAVEINARDWLGRTVLHLACASTEPAATEYVRMLLAHPSINVNIQDDESHWTALHRALYSGHLAAA